MERKLAEFRARKKAQTEAMKPAVIQSEMKVISDDSPAVTVDSTELKPNTCPKSPLKQDHDDDLLNTTSGCWLQCLVLNHLTLFKVLLWLVLLGLFSELEFGLPFFLISLFYWLYEGLRSPKAKQPGEMSAYSVFNPDCQPILGTLTAEQLEGEMGYRAIPSR